MSLSTEELLKLIQAAQVNSQINELVTSQQTTTSEDHGSPAAWSALPNIDISLLDPLILNQVRSEYLAQQHPSTTSTIDFENDKAAEIDDISIEAAKSITPEVLVQLSKLTKESDMLTVLRQMREDQHTREREMWNRREELKKRLNVDRNHLLARELIGIDISNELEELERKIADELKTFDQSIIRDMDRQKKRQEEQLCQLKVPFFRANKDPTIIKLQSRVFKILLDMLED
ncbi:unnamed protein product [Umbelopsis vinacea]